MSSIIELVAEQAGLTWLESLGWQVKYGPDIAPGTLAAERDDLGHTTLTWKWPWLEPMNGMVT